MTSSFDSYSDTSRNYDDPLPLQKRETTAKPSKFLLYFFIFLVGGFLGVLVETIWIFIKSGMFEIRSGFRFALLLNPIYGAGAVLLTIFGYHDQNRPWWKIFLKGVLIGGVFEYIASWGQELVMGAVSWNYETMPLNLNGRINLVFCLAWGVLAIIWAKIFLPPAKRIVAKMQGRIWRWIAIICTILLALDLAWSVSIMTRWSYRSKGIPPKFAIQRYIDEHYPDERVDKYFPSLNVK